MNVKSFRQNFIEGRIARSVKNLKAIYDEIIESILLHNIKSNRIFNIRARKQKISAKLRKNPKLNSKYLFLNSLIFLIKTNKSIKVNLHFLILMFNL